MESLEGLPAWVQAVITAGFFVGTAIVAIYGYTKRQLSKPADPSKPLTGDAVVISGAFADSKAIHDLKTAIQELTDCTRSQTETNERQVSATARVVAAVEALTDVVRAIRDEVRSMRT